MWPLSNLRSKSDAPQADWIYRPAPPEARWSALSLILATSEGVASDAQVEDFLTFARLRELNFDDLWIAQQGETIGWAVFPLVSPGKTMVILGPDGSITPPAHAGGLIQSICTSFAERGVELAQVLLNPTDRALKAMYESHGFVQMAELVYLGRHYRKAEAAPDPTAGIEVLTYASHTHAKFIEAIEKSYRESLDCPQLNGMRGLEETLAGHKAVGVFDPELWFVLVENESPIAALLLSRSSDTEGVELVYLGVAPEGRGRGIGDWLMKWAGYQVKRANRSRLTLAVDSKNKPAMNLYFRHGFQKLGTKLALIRDLRNR